MSPIALLAVATIGVAAAADPWIYYQPRVRSITKPLDNTEAAILLANVCAGPLSGDPLRSCPIRSLGAGFDFQERFHPETVIHGHFWDAKSEDALVGGWSVETHPALWRGTLLLTKQRGQWVPKWYKSSLVTERCDKSPLPGGREILVCEVEDGGMGHKVHYLYSVDARRPMDLRKRTLVVADTYEAPCEMSARQEIERVAWEDSSGERQLVVTFRSNGPGIVTKQIYEDCEAFSRRPVPPMRRSFFRFRLTENGMVRGPSASSRK